MTRMEIVLAAVLLLAIWWGAGHPLPDALLLALALIGGAIVGVALRREWKYQAQLDEMLAKTFDEECEK